MNDLSLKQRLLRWLKNNPGFHASGDLQRLVAQHTTYTPRTTVRRLEELAVCGELIVEYRKRHAYYKFAEKLSPDEFWNYLSEKQNV